MSVSIQEYLSAIKLVNKDQLRSFSLVVDRVSTCYQVDEIIEARHTETSQNITVLRRGRQNLSTNMASKVQR